MLSKLAKRLLKPTVNRFGFDIVRYPPVVPKPERLIQKPFNVLQFVVAHYATVLQPFWFVQIGANDGLRWDPLHDLVSRFHFPGLLVEPLPDAFGQLRKNYAAEPQLAFENCAIAPEDGARPLYRVRADAAVGDWAPGIASFHRAHLLAHLDDVEKREELVEEILVPTMTVASLLQKHRIDQIALLQIDTEGFDYEILKMFFEQPALPHIINFESVHLSAHDQQESRHLLVRNGYRFIDVGIDTLAIRDAQDWPPRLEPSTAPSEDSH